MTCGILVDMHGTLVCSNQAWIRALSDLDPKNSSWYEDQVMNKRDRRELASKAGVSLDELEELYHSNVSPRVEIISLLKSLSENYPMVIVSRAPMRRVERDLKKVEGLHFLKIYARENSDKSDSGFLERILDEHGWDSAFMLGNDLVEDYVFSDRIRPLLVPDKQKSYYFKS